VTIVAEAKKYEGKTNFAVYAVWAALISVASLLPSIPMVGTGGTFSLKAIVLPLAGILFGPAAGAIICAIGGFIGQMLAPHTAWMGIATFITGIFTGTIAGFVSRGNWKIPLGLLVVFTGLWLSTSIGRQAIIFPAVFYSLGAVTIILGGMFAKKWLLGSNPALRGAAIWLSAFSGFVLAAGYANFVGGILMLQLPAQVWAGLAFISPIERAVFSLGAAIIGVPLLVGLPKIGVFVGPKPEGE
jgi:uncharacterized membrane protein